MDIDKVKQLLASCDDQKKQLLYKFLIEKQKIYERNPLLKFDHKASEKQQTFLNFTKDIQLFFGANKSGKTATMTYKGSLIMKGLQKDFKFKPVPGKPLYAWFCGKNREMLDGTPTRELLAWWNPEDYEIKWNSQGHIRKIIFKSPDKGETHLIYKPYDAGTDTFETENAHFVMCDEEIPKDIFAALQPRVFAYRGWILNTLTRTNGLTYVTEMIEEEGEFGSLMKEGYVEHVQSTLFDNKFFTKEDHKRLAASYNPESATYKIRVLGLAAANEGAPFDIHPYIYTPDGHKENWHAFEDWELPDDWLETGKWFGDTDYGRRDPFAAHAIMLTPCGTHWFMSEIEQRGVDPDKQALMIYNMFKYWQTKPKVIAGDCQINGNHAGVCIKNEYLKVLPKNWTQWDTRYELKADFMGSMGILGQNLHEPLDTTKKPKFRYHAKRCRRTLKQLSNLLWSEGGSKEPTSGRDDLVAANRYWSMTKIEYNNYKVEKEVAGRKKGGRWVRPVYNTGL